MRSYLVRRHATDLLHRACPEQSPQRTLSSRRRALARARGPVNIPARYCSGYLGDIGLSPVDLPMDFSGWFEAYLGGRWYTFDPRHNAPRTGRILVWTDEVLA